MSENLAVHIVYRDEDLKPVAEGTYPLKDFTTMLATDIKKIISDVEDLAYIANDGRPKSEWDDLIYIRFMKTKHKLLDKAGEIERLPDNLVGVTSDGQSVSKAPC